MSAGVLEELLAEIRALRADLAAKSTAKPAEVTIAAYAAARSIAESTVRDAIKEGRLTAVRYGRAVRVAADAVISTKLAPEPTAETPSAFAMRVLGGAR